MSPPPIRPTGIARLLVNLPPSVWLVTSGLLMTGLFYFGFTKPYSLEAYGNKPLQTLAILNHFSADGSFLYVGGFAALFGLYWFALRQIRDPRRQHTAVHWVVVIVFAAILNLVLLPMYPADSADLYDNIIRGRMSAIYGLNPLVEPPSRVQDDPFYRFAAWHDTPSAYGPLWELIAGFAAHVAGDEYGANIVTFKLVSILGYGLTTLLIGLSMSILAPGRRLYGVTLFAWNPLVIFMTAATAHNDAVMTLFVVLGILLLLKRCYIASTLALVAGALVKLIPLLLIPVVVVAACQGLTGMQRVRYLVVSSLLGVLFIIAAYAPFLSGLDPFGRLDAQISLYTGSIWTLARQTLAPVLDDVNPDSAPAETPNSTTVTRLAASGLFGLFYVVALVKMLRRDMHDRSYVIRLLAMIIVFYLLVACLWVQAWYAIWIVPLAALIEDTPLRRLIILFSYLVTWQSFLYNTIMFRPGQPRAPLPWRDLLPVLVTIGITWAYVGWFWLSTWLRSGQRTPYSMVIGRRVAESRVSNNLTPFDLSEESGMRVDDLLSFERGERSIPFDHIQAICNRLSLPVTQLVASNEP